MVQEACCLLYTHWGYLTFYRAIGGGDLVLQGKARRYKSDIAVLYHIIEDILQRYSKVIFAQDVKVPAASHTFQERPGTNIPVADDDGCHYRLFSL